MRITPRHLAVPPVLVLVTVIYRTTSSQLIADAAQVLGFVAVMAMTWWALAMAFELVAEAWRAKRAEGGDGAEA